MKIFSSWYGKLPLRKHIIILHVCLKISWCSVLYLLSGTLHCYTNNKTDPNNYHKGWKLLFYHTHKVFREDKNTTYLVFLFSFNLCLYLHQMTGLLRYKYRWDWIWIHFNQRIFSCFERKLQRISIFHFPKLFFKFMKVMEKRKKIKPFCCFLCEWFYIYI